MPTRRRKTKTVPGQTVMGLLDDLNPEQQQVVMHKDGPALVVAVAGAGKTRALVHRIAYLIAFHAVKAAAILAVTFSKKAADEMNERLKSLGVDDARVGTWHSVAWEIVRKERSEFAGWEVDSKDRFKTLVKIVLGYQFMNWQGADLGIVLSYISRCKAFLAEPGTREAEAIANEVFKSNPCAQTNPSQLMTAYAMAQDEAEQRRLMTFDDMLVECWKILRDDENARVRWATKWGYVLQDEAQDQNYAQITIGEMLARDHKNYMLVGDPAQSVYGFRGAVPEKLLAFEQDWGAKVIRMHRNYRCGNQIVAAANGSIRAMDPATHLGVELTGERDTDANVVVNQYADMDQEGSEVATKIAEYAADGVDWGDMVVLYRTNSQSRGVEEACLSNRIPYVVLGGTNFYERKEVKDLLAYVRVAAGRGKFEDVKRCINAPFRFLGRAFVDKIEEASGLQYGDTDWIKAVNDASGMARVQRRQQSSVNEWVGIIEGLTESIRQSREGCKDITIPTEIREKHGPAACLERVIKETDYMRYLTRDEGAETAENNRVSNVRELVRAAERFDTIDALLDYIETTLNAAKEAKDNAKGNRVILCSLHRSKGLEWPVVFVIGCNEGILPHRKADGDGEERRLFYVGVTRAKDNLHLSHVTTAALGNKVIPMEPSAFLNEAGLI